MAETEFLDPLALDARRRRRRWATFGVCVVLAAGGFGLVKPAYRAAKGWRAQQLVTEGKALFAQRQWAAAAEKAQAAYQMRPDAPAVLRLLARLESAGGRPAKALPLWQLLRQAGAAGVDDDRAYAADLLQMGALSEAEPEIKRLLEEQPENAANLRLGARLFLAQRLPEKSLALAEKAVRSDAGNEEGQLLLAILQADSPVAETRATGRQRLLQLAPNPQPIGLEAWLALANRRDLAPEQVQMVIDGLRAHPAAEQPHRLLALALEVDLRPDDRAALLDRAVTAGQAEEPPAQQALGVWLNARKEFARTLTLLPLEKALQRKDLFLVHLDALAGLDRWSDLDSILKRPRVPLDDAYAEVFRARCMMELGEGGRSEIHWKKAATAARQSPEQMWFVANYAEKIGRNEPAEAAYRSLTTSASTARAAFEGLLRVAGKQGDSKKLHSVLREMRSRWPKDDAVQNDYAYLSLLLKAEVDDACQTAAQLVVRTPASLPHRTTLALAHLRTQRVADALAVYDGLKIPWPQVPPSQRAIHAAVLGANGKVEEAGAMLQGVRAEELRPEERELVKPWLQP